MGEICIYFSNDSDAAGWIPQGTGTEMKMIQDKLGCALGKHSCMDWREAGWHSYGLKCVPEDSGSSKLNHPQHRPLFCQYCHHEPQRKGSTKKAYIYKGNIGWADGSESSEEDSHRIVPAGLQPENLLPLL